MATIESVVEDNSREPEKPIDREKVRLAAAEFSSICHVSFAHFDMAPENERHPYTF